MTASTLIWPLSTNCCIGKNTHIYDILISVEKYNCSLCPCRNTLNDFPIDGTSVTIKKIQRKTINYLN